MFNAKTPGVQIKAEEDHIKMATKDDRKGFISGNAKQGNGLSNMQERAAQMKGRISIESAEGSGTTITLVFNFR